MAIPQLNFASIDLSSAKVYSTSSNTNTFIRVRATYVASSNTVTVTDDVASYFGSGSIEVGYRLRSPSEFSSPVVITSWDEPSKTLTVAGGGGSAQNGTNQLTFISLPAGKIFVESASFSKPGGNTINKPSSFNDVTGSLDANYDSDELEWGVAGLMTSTASANTGLQGKFGQYMLTSFERRNSSTSANIFLSASDTIPAFKEEVGYSLGSEQAQAALFLSERSGSLMTIAGSDDINGNQSLGLSTYQTIVASTLAALTSGSSGAGFPFSGSAEITGSLAVTGSSEFTIPVGNEANNFFIKSGSAANDPRVFNVNGEGTIQFFAQDNAYIPTAILGGLYFTSASAYIGIE
tara:strand:+ start:3088 stop:4137 length:1050 start_codon:yes stop_codon:yes gene_type:complete